MSKKRFGISEHAKVPPSLYADFLRIAKFNSVVKGDKESAEWLENEKRVRDYIYYKNEWNSIRHKLGKPIAKCVGCGRIADTYDHIIPLSQGGTNELKNLQPMCRECNSKKSDK